MPLRDHFRPPLDNHTSWEGFHGQWPAMIVNRLNRHLPPEYAAEPRVHLGSVAEIDVATFEKDEPSLAGFVSSDDNGGGVATAVWAPPAATFTVATDLPDLDEYEVRVYDRKHGRRLVAAVEILSPSNKDRPEHRRAFVAKYAAFLQNQVCVSIIDLVTPRNFNLYGELMALLGLSDPFLTPEPPALYAVSCRTTNRKDIWQLEVWAHALALGQPLPKLPLWLTDDLAVPLELDETYEETCRSLRLT